MSGFFDSFEKKDTDAIETPTIIESTTNEVSNVITILVN